MRNSYPEAIGRFMRRNLDAQEAGRLPQRVGRWALNDIAERKQDGKLYRVTGFILNPAVSFREILPDGELGPEEMVHVAGCLNEITGLRLYQRVDET
jgi:hypothetical protein